MKKTNKEINPLQSERIKNLRRGARRRKQLRNQQARELSPWVHQHCQTQGKVCTEAKESGSAAARPGKERSSAPTGRQRPHKRPVPAALTRLRGGLWSRRSKARVQGSSAPFRALREAWPKCRARRERRAGRDRPRSRRAHAQQGTRSRVSSARNIGFRGLTGRKWRLLPPLDSSRLEAAAAPCP